MGISAEVMMEKFGRNRERSGCHSVQALEKIPHKGGYRKGGSLAPDLYLSAEIIFRGKHVFQLRQGWTFPPQ